MKAALGVFLLGTALLAQQNSSAPQHFTKVTAPVIPVKLIDSVKGQVGIW